ncbi:MAG: prepilin-type N-terminal cleavage/methylation domain-containing protein [Candidatus Gracilibacteria bacterium]|nr:prepilin-type N-terminal cleavage/methylation domain-containing protein [Candidatus Gracilibacteria bacterium]
MSTVKNSTRGFTLIELLVVITIIGILATGGVVGFTSQLQKARDTDRISGLKTLQGAIESYGLDNTAFPNSTLPASTGPITPTVSAFTGMLASYVTVMPKDKKSSSFCANGAGGTTEICDYAYAVGVDKNSVKNAGYVLSTAFENDGNAKAKGNNTDDKGACASRLEVGVAYSVAVGGIAAGIRANCLNAAPAPAALPANQGLSLYIR